MRYKCCRKCSRHNYYPEQRTSRARFYKGLHEVWLSNIKSNLVRGHRIIKCDLTLDDLYNQLIKQNSRCAYSGIELDVLNKYKLESNASVDRIDSTKDYTKDNIQWVYKPINIMKNGLSSEDFISLCDKISEYQKQINSDAIDIAATTRT